MVDGTGNVSYASQALVKYYQGLRRHWDEFYLSERKVFEHVAPTADTRVLDMGCGCAGLGTALRERFGINSYTGVDINPYCITEAISRCSWGTFHLGDFLEVQSQLDMQFDLAVSLSCADWNVRTLELWSCLFQKVKSKGHFVFSCRLSNSSAVQNYVDGVQKFSWPIGSTQPEATESASYKVFSLDSILTMLTALQSVKRIYMYGYWGTVPENVEGLELEKVFYTVVSAMKGDVDDKATSPAVEFHGDANFLIRNAK
jgi:SAM-dependent methyltransferase